MTDVFTITATDANADGYTYFTFPGGIAPATSEAEAVTIVSSGSPAAVGTAERHAVAVEWIDYDSNGNVVDYYWTVDWWWSYVVDTVLRSPEIVITFAPLSFGDSGTYIVRYDPTPVALPNIVVDVSAAIEGYSYNYIGSAANDIANFFSSGSYGTAGGYASGGSGDDDFNGATGDDVLEGGAGNDTLTGNAGADTLRGGAGDDIINGGVGDELSGGDGIDILYLDVSTVGSAGFVFRPADQVAAPVTLPGNTSVSGFEIINLIFGSGNDTLDLTGAVLSSRNVVNSHFTLGGGSDTILIDATSRNPHGYIYAAGGDDTLDVDLSALTTTATVTASHLYFDGFSINLHDDDTNDRGIGRILATGGSANDYLAGGTGDDVLEGGAGNDRLTGNAGADTLRGGMGDDIINGGVGDELSGGDGIDVLYLDVSSVDDGGLVFRPTDQSASSIVLPGNTSVSGFEIFDLTLGDGNDTLDLIGAQLSSRIVNNTVSSVFRLGGGSDTILIDATSRNPHGYIYAAGGDDTLDVDMSGLTTAATISAGFVGFDGFSMYVQDFNAVNYLIGRVVATGGNAGDDMDGGYGDDILDGGDGDDSLTGNAGADVLRGGLGDDSITGGDGDDTIEGGAGADDINGGPNGAAGDTASYQGSNTAVIINLGSGAALGGHAAGDTLLGIENIIGSAFGDTIYGDANANTLRGGAGDDTLAGQGGDDQLFGGTGNDSLSGGSDNDVIHGEDGNDRIFANAGNDTINGGAGDDFTNGGDGDDTINGGADDDNVLVGGNGSDTIHGDDGSDGINGSAGDDFLYGDVGNDRLYGGTGFDQMWGGDDDDTMGGLGDDDTMYGENGIDGMNGGGGNDMMYGEAGNDRLYGGLGADTLNGGADDDLLVGQGGIDTFVFEANWGHDQISGYGLDVTGLPFVDEVIDMSALGITFADLTIEQSGVHTLVYITADGSANNSIEILYRNVATITQSDFVF